MKSDLPLRDANTGNTWEEWVLVDGTPGAFTFLILKHPKSNTLGRCLPQGVHYHYLTSIATCSNLALYSIYPPGSFDLVIAGPNYGRNTSTAFALSS